MFDLVSETWNPVVGCLHDCVYCWARRLAETKLAGTPRYRNGFKPQLVDKELEKRFSAGKLVFVSSMGDLFGEWVPDGWLRKVLLNVAIHEDTQFLLLTKNPERMRSFKFGDNCIVGCTAESNRGYGVSKAPEPLRRLEALKKVDCRRKMVSVEPVMDFDLDVFGKAILDVEPEFIYVGYDNYGCGLVEPSLAKVRQLGQLLGTERVRWKALREPVQGACFPIAT